MAFRRIAGAAVLVVAAAVGYGVYTQDNIGKLSPAAGAGAHWAHDLLLGGAKAPTSAQAPSEAKAPTAVVSVAATKRVDYPVYIDGLGQVQAYNTVTVRTRVDGADRQDRLQGRPDRQGGRPAGPDRPAAVPGRARPGQGEEGAGRSQRSPTPSSTSQRYSTLAKQSFATQQQLDTQNALVNAAHRADRRRRRGDRRRAGAARLHHDPRADHRPRRLPAGRQGNIVNAAQQTGIVTITQLQPIAVIFTAPEDDVPRDQRRAWPPARRRSRSSTSDGAKLWRPAS